MEIFRDFFAMARHGNMGTRLPALYAQAGLTEIEIDTFQARLRDEAVAVGAVIPPPTMVGAVGSVRTTT